MSLYTPDGREIHGSPLTTRTAYSISTNVISVSWTPSITGNYSLILTFDGEDYWPQILEAYQDHSEPQQELGIPPRIIHTLKMIPNYYLGYFYNREKKLGAQDSWPPSRAEEVMQVEENLLKL